MESLFHSFSKLLFESNDQTLEVSNDLQSRSQCFTSQVGNGFVDLFISNQDTSIFNHTSHMCSKNIDETQKTHLAKVPDTFR